jgi:hypothetical protein
MSIRLNKRQSYNRFDERASNFLIDCRGINTIEDLREALAVRFSTTAESIFESVLNPQNHLMKYESKVLLSPLVYVYLTHIEDIFVLEKDRKGALDIILNSMFTSANRWPGELEFAQQAEIEKRLRFILYYTNQNEIVNIANNYINSKGLRVLDRLP